MIAVLVLLLALLSPAAGKADTCRQDLLAAANDTVAFRMEELFGSPSVAAVPPGVVFHADSGAMRGAVGLDAAATATAVYDKDRRVVHVACDGSSAGLARDLRHEIAHHFLFLRFGGLPRWLEEGVASYMEGDPRSDGAGVVSAERLREFKVLVRRNQVPSLRQVFALPPDSRLNSAGYAVAWALIFALAHHDDPLVQDRRRHELRALVGYAAVANAFDRFIAQVAAPGEDASQWQRRWLRELWKLPAE